MIKYCICFTVIILNDIDVHGPDNNNNNYKQK